jgi:hypothetical protein
VPVEKYAAAVRDRGTLFLFLWIKRSESGDFYVILPRPDDTSIDAHASYHADGQYHVKSHGTPKIMHRRRQKPDDHFTGTECLLEQKLTQTGPRSIGQVCQQMDWSAVFEIPASDLGDGNAHNTHLSADLIASGAVPSLVPNARVIRQVQYRVSCPFLILTLYEMPHLAP